MLKILFLIHDLSVGGAEKVLVNLVNNMDKDKFDITLMTLFDVGVNKQFLNDDIKYKTCFKYPIPGNSHYMKLLTPKRLYKWLIKDDYDIVISYLEGPTARIVAGAPDNVKVVSYIHITIPSLKALSRPFRSKKETIKCYQRADQMVYVSKTVMTDFQKLCETKNNIVLYNTIETNAIIRLSCESIVENDFSKNNFNWCGVGKLIPTKGFERMLRIQKRLLDDGFDVHFHALGVGPLENELKQFCIDNNLDKSVTFWGYQTNPYKYVANCDLYVCASFAEGFSTAATEALIVGTPVCTVEVSGMKEMLGDNNEYGIVTPNDEDELYKAIKRLVESPTLLEHYKHQAIERGKFFSTENTVRAVENMLESL